MSALDYVKQHPVMTGGVLLVAVVGVVLVLNTGGGSAANTSPQSLAVGDASTGAALAAAQLQAQARTEEVAATKAINESNNATQIAIAQIQQSLGLATINAQQTLGGMKIQSDEAVTINGQTLSAQVQNNVTSAQLQRELGLQATMQHQASVMLEQTRAITGAQVEASKPKGLFSWLFG